nr:ecdysis triggering hormone [Antheraea pernyi]
MSFKLATVFATYCLLCVLIQIEASFIKPNNVPRVGRSNEALTPFDQGMMGYVIKTNKNIPRMGRRNYDSENRYNIPKLYQFPVENAEYYGDEGQSNTQEQLDTYYVKQMENMKK